MDSIATFPANRASRTIGTSEDTPATAPAAVVTSLLTGPALPTAVARGRTGLNTMGNALIPRLNITDAIDAVEPNLTLTGLVLNHRINRPA